MRIPKAIKKWCYNFLVTDCTYVHATIKRTIITNLPQNSTSTANRTREKE